MGARPQTSDEMRYSRSSRFWWILLFCLLLVSAPAGRLYVARWREEIRIVDIALLPGHRSMGIGTRLLNDLISESEESSKPLSIHVERFNPALHLYDRLGFRTVADKGVYLLMERPATR